MSLLPSALKFDEPSFTSPVSSGEIPKYFTSDIPSQFISIIQNDWPYSSADIPIFNRGCGLSSSLVPLEVEHSLIWTRAPIFHEDLIAPCISARIEQDGLCGFTGLVSPPPSPTTLPSCLPALSEWGIAMETLIRSEKGTPQEEALVLRAGEEVQNFVRKRWIETEWETAWFVNPPVRPLLIGPVLD